MKKISSDKRFLVLGASGFLGSRVFAALRDRGASVDGTTHGPSDEALASLDLSDTDALAAFPWPSYDTVIDCTGHIGYERSAASAALDVERNLLAPLRVCSRLSTQQSYIYCSTHAVLAGEDMQNPYSLSKRAFERYADAFDGGPAMTILRLPGLFHETRENGLLHHIRSSFKERKPLLIESIPPAWHAMYLPRAAEAVVRAAEEAPRGIVSVGYPVPTDPGTILSAAEAAFGYAVPVTLGDIPHPYDPDVASFLSITADDLASDLHAYFSSP